ncbi:MAG TPA: DUF89 family protein [Firmicutes bacterium]|uniref:Damage-control phosphatase ARMT1-like metal-binding domain-containing protein n=1 Tax=candidate division TA06 bacterium TaxID=2250710 RepID=A0A660S9A3_UNCT6|nr:MAG: hypothetical protein DRP44_04895 [candidate division TA06 bacterium]HFD04767.1 DUF89 family protein [Bacillota bacterium]
MKIFPECIPCVLNQGIRTIKKITDNEKRQWELLRCVYDQMGQKWHEGISPIELSLIVNDVVVNHSGVSDPYLKDKDLQNNHALEYYAEIRNNVMNAKNPIKEGIKYAICGNKIDLGIFADIDVKKTIEMCEEIDISDDEISDFKRAICNESKILYLTDNAGEIVFDKILIDLMTDMGKEIYVGVRDFPIINDVTEREAKMLGFERQNIIPIKIGDTETLKQFSLVISKGQANFESYHMMKNIYFLFLIKCQILAKALNRPIYSVFFERYGDEI